MTGEKINYTLAVLMIVLIVRNIKFQEETYNFYKTKDFWKVFSLFIRVFESEINDPGKPLMRLLIINYGRQMASFFCRQLLYYGHIYDKTEFLIYLVMVPVLTFLSRQLPREYYIKYRYFIAYV